jgi:hypothetical protein
MELETIDDAVFGELGYDQPMEEWYAVVALTPSRRIEVTIWWVEADDGPFPPVLACARQAYLLFREREPEHRQALAVAMLKRYRRSARLQGALPEAKALARKLTAEQLSIAADGSATAHYDDATELFADHSIMAEFDPDGSFLGFTLQG